MAFCDCQRQSSQWESGTCCQSGWRRGLPGGSSSSVPLVLRGQYGDKPGALFRLTHTIEDLQLDSDVRVLRCHFRTCLGCRIERLSMEHGHVSRHTIVKFPQYKTIPACPDRFPKGFCPVSAKPDNLDGWKGPRRGRRESIQPGEATGMSAREEPSRTFWSNDQLHRPVHPFRCNSMARTCRRGQDHFPKLRPCRVFLSSSTFTGKNLPSPAFVAALHCWA
jgi:hypothetical protein